MCVNLFHNNKYFYVKTKICIVPTTKLIAEIGKDFYPLVKECNLNKR